jgi:hypothetical protein
MHRRGAEPQAEPVKTFEKADEEPVPRHDIVEVIAVRDVEPLVDIEMIADFQPAAVLEPVLLIVVSTDPEDASSMGFGDDRVQCPQMLGRKFAVPAVNRIAVQYQGCIRWQSLNEAEQELVPAVARTQV